MNKTCTFSGFTVEDPKKKELLVSHLVGLIFSAGQHPDILRSELLTKDSITLENLSFLLERVEMLSKRARAD